MEEHETKGEQIEQQHQELSLRKVTERMDATQACSLLAVTASSLLPFAVQSTKRVQGSWLAC